MGYLAVAVVEVAQQVSLGACLSILECAQPRSPACRGVVGLHGIGAGVDVAQGIRILSPDCSKYCLHLSW